MSANDNRPLSDSERQLARWMLENGTTEATEYLGQLDRAEVTPWRCPCGCATINIQIQGNAEPAPGVHILGDFVVGYDDEMYGIFIFSSEKLLRGIEVYSLTADPPRVLPGPEELRPCEYAQPKRSTH